MRCYTGSVRILASQALPNFHVGPRLIRESPLPVPERSQLFIRAHNKAPMTLIEIIPHRWGWKAFEAPGVEPVFPTKEDEFN